MTPSEACRERAKLIPSGATRDKIIADCMANAQKQVDTKASDIKFDNNLNKIIDDAKKSLTPGGSQGGSMASGNTMLYIGIAAIVIVVVVVVILLKKKK